MKDKTAKYFTFKWNIRTYISDMWDINKLMAKHTENSSITLNFS